MALSIANQWLLKPWMKPVLWLLCAVPALALCVGAFQNTLGANPAEAISHSTGQWALRWLWLTLLVTPLREMAHLPALLRYRRTLGVTSFAYAVLHLLAYVWLDQGWDVAEIVADVMDRTFILVGMLTFLLMLPLALTSFNAAVRALGGRKWQLLHKLVYAVSLLALLHFYLKREAKSDVAEVMVYAVILALLLGWRVVRRGGILAMLRVR